MMFGFDGIGMVIWLVVLGIVIWAILAAGARSVLPRTDRPARAILDERLARGELSIEEHRKLRAEL